MIFQCTRNVSDTVYRHFNGIRIRSLNQFQTNTTIVDSLFSAFFCSQIIRREKKMFQFTLSLAWSLMHAFKWKRAFPLLFFFSSFNRKMKSPNHTFMEYSYFFSLLVRNHSEIEIYLPKKWNVEFKFRYPLGESNELKEKICWCVEMKRVYEIRAKIEKKITHTNFFFFWLKNNFFVYNFIVRLISYDWLPSMWNNRWWDSKKCCA